MQANCEGRALSPKEDKGGHYCASSGAAGSSRGVTFWCCEEAGRRGGCGRDSCGSPCDW
ncbi:hypothetical protein HanXRQr2_Chr10g0423041 [Helianthus annuus]|uniref:Uncharacterized protein n=1 Tax=Helianthus annuus TaxID=4232 RepID=A0A9K3HUL9_HELAN|nr:hypothetical protein HanXRQr2_Chr10g0423041 [Helianthus annuus]